MANPVVRFEIPGPDGPALIDFYRKFFGWQLQDQPLPGWSHYAFLRSEAGIAGAIGTADATDAGVLIYIEVDDPHAYIAKLLSGWVRPSSCR